MISSHIVGYVVAKNATSVAPRTKRKQNAELPAAFVGWGWGDEVGGGAELNAVYESPIGS